MSKIILVTAIVIVTCMVVNVDSGIVDLLNNSCVKDSNCDRTEYCDHDFPNPIGKCRKGLEANEYCVLDRHCASKHCHLFHCKARAPIVP